MLAVERLRVLRGGYAAVDGLDLRVEPGERVAVVGESGSGKSTLSLAILGMVPLAGGRVLWHGADLATWSPAALRRYRGGAVALIPQDPLASLSPAVRVGTQLAEVAECHRGVTRREATRRAAALLERVGVPERALLAWPHELSGGQRQRAAIAMALLGEPELILADEPTTSLDAVAQAEVLRLLGDAARERALLLITHDLGVAAEVAERLVVMHAGRVVESGPTSQVLAAPEHTLTASLVQASPRLPW